MPISPTPDPKIHSSVVTTDLSSVPGNSVCVLLCLFICFCFVLFFKIPQESKITWFFLSPSDLFHLVLYPQVLPCYYKWQDFILFIPLWCVYIYFFFIHLSMNGHFDCFHTLAIISNAVMNMKVYMSFWISVLMFLDKYSEVQKPIILQFYSKFSEEFPYCFPQWLYHLPSYQHEGYLYSTTSPTLISWFSFFFLW